MKYYYSFRNDYKENKPNIFVVEEETLEKANQKMANTLCPYFNMTLEDIANMLEAYTYFTIEYSGTELVKI